MICKKGNIKLIKFAIKLGIKIPTNCCVLTLENDNIEFLKYLIEIGRVPKIKILKNHQLYCRCEEFLKRIKN